MEIEALKTAFVAWCAESEGRAPSAAEADDFATMICSGNVVTGEDLQPEVYPEFTSMPPELLVRFVPIPAQVPQAEFLYVPSTAPPRDTDEQIKTALFVNEWNICWESGQLRHQMFGEDVPQCLQWLRNYADRNVFLLPRGATHQYHALAPLFHMLPKRVLSRHGLPALKRGIWPHWQERPWLQHLLPKSFDTRLSTAFADWVWSCLDSGSGLAAFSKTDPLRLLAHNLDFWLPHAHQVAERRLRSFPRAPIEDEEQERELKARQRTAAPYGVTIDRPRTGGVIWCGEDDAQEVRAEVVEVADRHGNLRAIIDAIRSNRVEDDFSARWSFAKEDFERKLYSKRSKVSVSFVELDETIPVHGPESEAIENTLWSDFMGLLDQKERQITVLLRSGTTKLGDIATEMGYANHSPVSKALSRIRLKAEQYLN